MKDSISRKPEKASKERWGPGLSGRLMLLAILFVLIAEILIYVPSVANFRNSWLSDRLAQARAAALVLERMPPDSLPRDLVDDLLKGMDASMIALRIEQSRRLLAIADMPPPVEIEVDLRSRRPASEILSAFDILIFGQSRTMRVVGAAPGGVISSRSSSTSACCARPCSPIPGRSCNCR